MKIHAGVLALIVFLPAAGWARKSRPHQRKAKVSRHRVQQASLPASRTAGATTLEPFGPPAPASVRRRAPADEIGRIAVVEGAGPKCPAQDVVAEACDEGEMEPGPAVALPAKSRGALGNLTHALLSFRDLFRPKSAEAEVSPDDVNLSELLGMGLEIPVQGVTPDELRDSFLELRGGRRHHREHLAIDIGAPRGTPVLAVADGEIVRIRRERRGGNSIYLRDLRGRYLFYYCHLWRYARGLRAGQRVQKGEILGFVGATGNAHGAHLHFSVTRLPDDTPDFRRGLAVNPYLVFLFGVQP